jgi:hypothetical protein
MGIKSTCKHSMGVISCIGSRHNRQTSLSFPAHITSIRDTVAVERACVVWYPVKQRLA